MLEVSLGESLVLFTETGDVLVLCVVSYSVGDISSKKCASEGGKTLLSRQVTF